MAAVLLGTVLALAGAGTATAMTSGSAGNRTPSVTQASTHHGTTQHLNSRHAAAGVTAYMSSAAAPSLARGWLARGAPAPKKAPAHQAAAPQSLSTWSGIEHTAAGVASGTLPASQQLMPVSVSGSQSYLPMTSARMANATTIVREAMHKHMGLRSAVIAVATSMQESQLLNLGFGTYDSLGLFQQRPSAGWGSASQIMNPVYASDAFLSALQHYQANNPGWASQPLWQAAQGVQNSGFPYAYAQWETQAAHVVAQVARGML
jgi:hypothetical protein